MRGDRRARFWFVFAVVSLLAGPATAAFAQVPIPLPVQIPIDMPAPDPGELLEGVTALPAELGLPGTQLTASAAGAGELVGLFQIKPGECGAAGFTGGSYFRMVVKLGTAQAGPFVPNLESSCGDKSYSALKPGTEGGISTAGYQPHPSPAFAGLGGGTNAKITAPQTWFGVPFATATNEKDPQTGTGVPMPKIVHDGSGKLSGDIRAFAAAWNGQHFNQGSPKPDGSSPGQTTPVSGTYDEGTGAFMLHWTSSIVGGPFDGFTGIWHFEGTFKPAAAQAAPTQSVSAQPEQGASEVQAANVIPLTGVDAGVPLTAGLLLITAGVWLELYGRRRCRAAQR